MTTAGALYILPALRATPDAGGRILLTRKFLDGAAAYAERWPGPVMVCMSANDRPDGNLDHVSVEPDELPFSFRWLEASDRAVTRQIRPASLVLASLVDRHTRMAERCASCGIALVYVSEYSLRTRRQIIRAETANPLLRVRRTWWTTQLEKRYERAVRAADGVQCNGTPVFQAYANVNRSPLLYFDSRVRRSMIVEPQILKARTDELRRGGALRLAFSGRLIPMKGADHLPLVAAELNRLGVAFRMDIYGAGESERAIRAGIDRLNLAGQVVLRGVLEFERELVPRISRDVDLFVCCHRQGDPSCTYLETMSCGTPIVGYDNEAFAGIVRHSGVGWPTPTDDPRALAGRIAALDADRACLAEAADRARVFAERHSFEDTMQRRVEHMRSCARSEQRRVA